MTDIDDFAPELFGLWPASHVYEGDPSQAVDADRAKAVAEACMLETKSVASPAEELRVLLNEMTSEMREQFAAFRALRRAAEQAASGNSDDAAAKLARADLKAATDAMSLIVRTLEKIDQLQRQFARDREQAAEESEAARGLDHAKTNFSRLSRSAPKPAPGNCWPNGSATALPQPTTDPSSPTAKPNRAERNIATANTRQAAGVFGGLKHGMGAIMAKLADDRAAIKDAVRSAAALAEDIAHPQDRTVAAPAAHAPVVEAAANRMSRSADGDGDAEVDADVGKRLDPSQPDRSVADMLDLPAEELAERLALWPSLGNLWAFTGRDEQQPPPGDWRTWLIMGGRGSGKTRAGAEWVHAIASAGRSSDLRIALIAETLGDAREVMIDGISGIMRIARRCRPEFEISRRRLVWPNGAVAQIFSSEDPESLRGPQFHFAWSDELHPCIVSEFSIPLIACFCEQKQLLG